MGISFLVPGAASKITAVVRWGDYVESEMREKDGKAVPTWQRVPREETMRLALAGGNLSAVDIPDSGGLQLHVVARLIREDLPDDHVLSGARSVSIFLVNHRRSATAGEEKPDAAYVFQPEIEVICDDGFVARPDLSGLAVNGWDDRVADLHYAETPGYATGHGVSADWDVVDGRCRTVRTVWIPGAEVEKTITSAVPDVELSMDALGNLSDGSAAESALRPLVVHYQAWIREGEGALTGLHGHRSETARELLRLAGLAADREIVDLLFFPTGGGKTEAYLGLAAFAMVLRRLRNPGQSGKAGAGVSVIMRYTLRLLTLDQLSRAAGLVCALELERDRDTARYGEWPFEIGLWVGKAATPNLLGFKGDKRNDSARGKVRRFKENPRGRPSPIPLENCPWCGERFKPESFALLPNDDRPQELRIVCMNSECDFTRDRALPIVAVDEPIYRRLPAFVIATVDKFASLPWVGQSGMLLGGAVRHDNGGFYGPADPGRGKPLDSPLPPPDLIIQDELHLISGPLGTMAGLYESAIEALCERRINGHTVRPKIIASTATVRQAGDQIQALFCRDTTQIFPPPGPDRRDSFFARTVPSSETPARLYLGIAALQDLPAHLRRRLAGALETGLLVPPYSAVSLQSLLGTGEHAADGRTWSGPDPRYRGFTRVIPGACTMSFSALPGAQSGRAPMPSSMVLRRSRSLPAAWTKRQAFV